jgi:hypothetical protein
MRKWLLEAESIFAGKWTSQPEEITQAAVGERLAQWLDRLRSYVSTLAPSTPLFEGLSPLIDTLTHLRPHLVCCYAIKGLPRTNNDLERCIRAIKTRYRRICGRKNWNAYVLRYGSSVAFYEWWATRPQEFPCLEARLSQMTRGPWRALRQRARTQHQEQLDRFRFQHHRPAFLAALETRWLETECMQ